jgi:hypothetical protein
MVFEEIMQLIKVVEFMCIELFVILHFLFNIYEQQLLKIPDL